MNHPRSGNFQNLTTIAKIDESLFKRDDTTTTLVTRDCMDIAILNVLELMYR